MKIRDSVDKMLREQYRIKDSADCAAAEEEGNVALFMEFIELHGIKTAKKLLNELFGKTESGELSFVDFCYSMLEGGLPVPFEINAFGRKIKSATISESRRLFGLAIRQAHAR